MTMPEPLWFKLSIVKSPSVRWTMQTMQQLLRVDGAGNPIPIPRNLNVMLDDGKKLRAPEGINVPRDGDGTTTIAFMKKQWASFDSKNFDWKFSRPVDVSKAMFQDADHEKAFRVYQKLRVGMFVELNGLTDLRSIRRVDRITVVDRFSRESFLWGTKFVVRGVWEGFVESPTRTTNLLFKVKSMGYLDSTNNYVVAESF